MRLAETYSTRENSNRVPQQYILKRPAQVRSTMLVHRILDTTVLILQDSGSGSLTTNIIADRAGINIASVYQYFANKEMILSAIVERVLLEAGSFIEATVANSTRLKMEEMLQTILKVLLAELKPYRAVVRELFVQADLLSDESVLTLIEDRLNSFVRDFLSMNSDRYVLVGGSAAIFVANQAVIFLFLKWLATDPPHISESDFIDALIAQYCSCIEPGNN